MGFNSMIPRRQANYGSVPYGNGAGGIPGGGGMRHGAVMVPGPSAGGAAPAAMAPGVTPFQTSINNQRAREAVQAGTFAANAPLPQDGDGYNGAHGTRGGGVPGQAAIAARTAYVAGKALEADQASGGRVQSMGLAEDANARENMTSTAKAGAVDAWTAQYPGQVAAQVGVANSAAALNNAKTAVIPGQAAAQNGVANSTAAVNNAKATAYPAESAANQEATKAGGQAKVMAADASPQIAAFKQQMAQMQKQHAAEIAKYKQQLGKYEKEAGGDRAAKMRMDPTQAQPSAVTPMNPQSAAPAAGNPGQSQYSQADVEHTAERHGISTDEVLRRLGQGVA